MKLVLNGNEVKSERTKTHKQIVYDAADGRELKTGTVAHMEHHKAIHTSPVFALLKALGSYADGNFKRFESRLSDDYVLGPAWLDMVKGLRALLDGETCGLDGGTMDHALIEMLTLEGFKEGEDY